MSAAKASCASSFTAIIGVLVLTGCATTTTPQWKQTSYGSWKLTQSEIAKLPTISIRNILSSESVSEHQRMRILVRTAEQEDYVEVKNLPSEDEAHVLTTDAHGREIVIAIDHISEIQSIRQIRTAPRQTTAGEKAEGAAEALIYAPLLPLLATWPLLRATGLDANKNAEDAEKAMRAYGGMSKHELVAHVGAPLEKYHCDDKSGGHEVWVYSDEQVIRGGRALFIRLTDGQVYHASFSTTFFKDACSPLKGTP